MGVTGKVLEPFAVSWWRFYFFGALLVRRQDPPGASAEGLLTLHLAWRKPLEQTRPVPASTNRIQRNRPYDPPAGPVRVSCRCKKKQKKALERIELSTISYFVAIRGTPVQLRTSGALPLG